MACSQRLRLDESSATSGRQGQAWSLVRRRCPFRRRPAGQRDAPDRSVSAATRSKRPRAFPVRSAPGRLVVGRRPVPPARPTNRFATPRPLRKRFSTSRSCAADSPRGCRRPRQPLLRGDGDIDFGDAHLDVRPPRCRRLIGIDLCAAASMPLDIRPNVNRLADHGIEAQAVAAEEWQLRRRQRRNVRIDPQRVAKREVIRPLFHRRKMLARAAESTWSAPRH